MVIVWWKFILIVAGIAGVASLIGLALDNSHFVESNQGLCVFIGLVIGLIVAFLNYLYFDALSEGMINPGKEEGYAAFIDYSLLLVIWAVPPALGIAAAKAREPKARNLVLMPLLSVLINSVVYLLFALIVFSVEYLVPNIFGIILGIIFLTGGGGSAVYVLVGVIAVAGAPIVAIFKRG